MLLRPVALEVRQRRDSLALSQHLAQGIRQSKTLGFGLLDVSEHPDAWSLSVEYRIKGEAARVRAWLADPVTGEVTRIRAQGSANAPDELAANVLKAVESVLSN